MSSPTVVYTQLIPPAEHTPDKAAGEKAHLHRLCQRDDWASVTKWAEQSLACACLALDVLKQYGAGWCRDVEAAIDEMHD